MRTTNSGIAIGFYCDRHRQSTDRPIPSERLELRVRVKADVTFAGTSYAGIAARSEALERLRLAVEAAGGVLSLVDVESQVGIYRAPALAGAFVRTGGRGQ